MSSSRFSQVVRNKVAEFNWLDYCLVKGLVRGLSKGETAAFSHECCTVIYNLTGLYVLQLFRAGSFWNRQIRQLPRVRGANQPIQSVAVAARFCRVAVGLKSQCCVEHSDGERPSVVERDHLLIAIEGTGKDGSSSSFGTTARPPGHTTKLSRHSIC